MLRWLTCALLAGAAATACGDAFGIEDVLGVWSATSINGDAVPGIVVVDGVEYDVQYFRLTFDNGGDCSWALEVDGDAETNACTYTVDLEQSTITIDLLMGDSMWGSVDGDEMRLTDDDGETYVLRKQ
jgi:hypothetical protein